MRNSYWAGRARRDVPQVNYNESSSEEEDFNSPLVSPSRPPVSRAGSPVELAVPTLNDNVDEDLEVVRQTLRNVGHTHTFRGTHPRPDPEGGPSQEQQAPSEEQISIPAGHDGGDGLTGEEEVLEGHVVGGGNNLKVEAVGGDARSEEGGNARSEAVGGDARNEEGGNARSEEDEMAGDDVDFEVENGQDGAKAIEYSRTLKIDYNPANVEFWFTNIENEMYTCEVKSQWLKRCILVKNLPSKVQMDVMSLLSIKKSGAPADLYKKIKDEILRIHSPRKQDTYKKALSRVLTGLPSQLGQELINDICDKDVKLVGCCCPKAVFCLWSIQLPLTVRSQISNLTFDHSTYQEVFQKADNIYLSTKVTEVSASVAAVHCLFSR